MDAISNNHPHVAQLVALDSFNTPSLISFIQSVTYLLVNSVRRLSSGSGLVWSGLDPRAVLLSLLLLLLLLYLHIITLSRYSFASTYRVIYLYLTIVTTSYHILPTSSASVAAPSPLHFTSLRLWFPLLLHRIYLSIYLPIYLPIFQSASHFTYHASPHLTHPELFSLPPSSLAPNESDLASTALLELLPREARSLSYSQSSS